MVTPKRLREVGIPGRDLSPTLAHGGVAGENPGSDPTGPSLGARIRGTFGNIDPLNKLSFQRATN